MRQILRNNLANEIRRHIRTAKRSISREVSLADVALAALPDNARKGTDSPDARAQSDERGAALTRTLRELPEHYRQALVLHTCEGLTFARVGEQLRCSSEAARKLWGRAAEELRKLLGNDCPI
jgi:RNA polymerase sigma factor (sigma-70 family)